MNVLLIDDDADFRRRFGTYIARNCSSIMLSVSDSASIAADLEELWPEPELILVDARSDVLEALAESTYRDSTVALLPEDPGGVREGARGAVREVFKYLSAPSLISSIPELAETFEGLNFRRKRAGDVSLYAVTGFSGGCGRTTFAVTLSRLNQQMMNRTTLLLSTERYSDLTEYFQTAAGEVSDSNLLLLNLLSGFQIVPSRFLLQDHHGVCTLAAPANGASDMKDLSREDVQKLLEAIQAWDMFDTIVFDIGMGEHEMDRFVLDSADRIYVLHDGRRDTIRAERRWLEKLYPLQERTVFTHVMNFHERVEPVDAGDGEGEQARPVYEGQYEIPFDPESFFHQEGKIDIRMTGRYSHAVSHALKGREFAI